MENDITEEKEEGKIDIKKIINRISGKDIVSEY
jgi:hypothetical protein